MTLDGITENTLIERAYSIKPIIIDDSGQHHFVAPKDIKEQNMLWNTKYIQKATQLTKIKKITSYHPFGYGGLFKPTVGEVLSQISQSDIDTHAPVAFSIESSGFSHGDTTHSAIVTLYSGTLPETVASQYVLVKGKTYTPNAEQKLKTTFKRTQNPTPSPHTKVVRVKRRRNTPE